MWHSAKPTRLKSTIHTRGRATSRSSVKYDPLFYICTFQSTYFVECALILFMNYGLIIINHILVNVARVAEATAGLNGPVAGARVQSAAGGAAAL